MDQLLEPFKEYIKPELLILIPVLFFIRMGLTKTDLQEKYILLILGAIGIALSGLWVIGTCRISVIGVFTAITQGILCAGISVLLSQLYAKTRKNE